MEDFDVYFSYKQFNDRKIQLSNIQVNNTSFIVQVKLITKLLNI